MRRPIQKKKSAWFQFCSFFRDSPCLGRSNNDNALDVDIESIYPTRGGPQFDDIENENEGDANGENQYDRFAIQISRGELILPSPTHPSPSRGIQGRDRSPYRKVQTMEYREGMESIQFMMTVPMLAIPGQIIVNVGGRRDISVKLPRDIRPGQNRLLTLLFKNDSYFLN